MQQGRARFLLRRTGSPEAPPLPAWRTHSRDGQRAFPRSHTQRGRVPSAEALRVKSEYVTAEMVEPALHTPSEMKVRGPRRGPFRTHEHSGVPSTAIARPARPRGDHLMARRHAWPADLALHILNECLSRSRTAAHSIPAARDAVLRWLLDTQKRTKGRLDPLEQELRQTLGLPIVLGGCSRPHRPVEGR